MYTCGRKKWYYTSFLTPYFYLVRFLAKLNLIRENNVNILLLLFNFIDLYQ